MTTCLEKFKAKPGTKVIKDEGKDYEFAMAALLALRCIQHTKNVWIATNAEGVGAFDDIILMITTEDDRRFDFLLQLKLKIGPTILTPRELQGRDKNLPFAKYCEDMVTLSNDLELEPKEDSIVTKNLGLFSNIYFVLFINRPMEISNFEQNKFLFYEIDKDDAQTSFLKSLINTYHGNNDCVFKFILPDIPESISTEGGENFTNFRLFTNQIHLKDLHQEIAAQILATAASNLRNGAKDIAHKFMKYIKDWANGDLAGNYYLTKDDILFKLTELCLSQYEPNLLRSKSFQFYDSVKKKIWNKLVLDKPVTVVDSDKMVSNFMFQFISTEVQRYCKGFTPKWCDELSEDQQGSFYQDYDDLKQPMLQLVGKKGKIGVIHIYKCAWRAKKLPLLLEIETSEEYENILEILKLSDYSYNVIILNGTSAQLPQHENITFQNLQDLNREKRDMVLKQPAELQGRRLPKLGNLLDETMLEDIKCKDIISILSGTFSIGEKIKSLPQYFIDRNTTKIFIKSQVFHSVYGEVFLLNQFEKEYLENLPNSNTIITNAEELDKQTDSNNIHCCSFYDHDHLQWNRTLGSTQKIRPYKVVLKDVFEADISHYSSNHTNIISEVPGMGKSVLMDYIAHKTPTTKWVLRINLNEHLDYLRRNKNCKTPRTNAREHLNYFFNEHGITLTKKVFEKLRKNKDVIVLLDGVDEVSISYTKEVTNIAMSLQREGYYIWLTTRPHVKEYLEEKFNTFATLLQPFTEENQKNFLVRYFSDKSNAAGCVKRIEEFVEGLLVATKKNLYDDEAKFAGIPLQTELLADYFFEKCKTCLEHSRAITFNEKFDLLDLYRSFIDKKLDGLAKTFHPAALEIRDKCQDHQPLLALQLVFPLEDFEQIEDIKQVNEYYKSNPDMKQHLQRDGVITIDEKLNITCTHRTFAEYLSAQWLSNNIDTKNEHLQEVIHDLVKQRFSKNYQFLFNVFDRFLAQNCDLHMAIINGQLDKAEKMINPNSVGMLDKGDRTVLHMLALCDDENLLDKMLQIVKKIPNLGKLCTKRDILGYTALDYALANKSSLVLADALCRNPNLAPINAYIELNFICKYLSDCEKLRLKALYDLLLPYFVTRGLLQNDTPDKIIKYYLKDKSVVPKPEFFRGFPRTILELVQSERGYPYSRYVNNQYSDLRYAIRFGTEENVEHVLSNCKTINQKDVDEKTPLHYAVLSQKLKTVAMLLSKGTNANKKISYNQSPLHLAFQTKNLDIIKLLLSNEPNCNAVDEKGQNILHCAVKYGDLDIVQELLGKVDLNKQDNDGNIPLHLALQENRMEIAKLLIDTGSDVDIVNNKNWNALHYVIWYDVMDIIDKCLFKDVDKNVQNMEGNAPLHLELMKSSVNVATVTFLINNGSDVNLQNQRKETPLHLVLNNPNSLNGNIPELLLNHGADINLTNDLHESAMHCAINSGNTRVIPMLLPKFKDVNQPNCYGDTCLHLASKNGETEMVNLLISRGANINGLNDRSETPLHLATNSRFTDTMPTLLAKGAAINIQDKDGNTPLHLAVMDNNPSVVKLLLTKDANVNKKNRKHKSPSDLAHKSSNSKMIALFPRCIRNGKKGTFDTNQQKKKGNNRRRVRKRPVYKES